MKEVFSYCLRQLGSRENRLKSITKLSLLTNFKQLNQIRDTIFKSKKNVLECRRIIGNDCTLRASDIYVENEVHSIKLVARGKGSKKLDKLDHCRHTFFNYTSLDTNLKQDFDETI